MIIPRVEKPVAPQEEEILIKIKPAVAGTKDTCPKGKGMRRMSPMQRKPKENCE